MLNWRSPLIQKVISGWHSVSAHSNRDVPVPLPLQPIYFDLELVDETLDDDPFERARYSKNTDVPKLMPGSSCRIRVSTSLNGRPGQQPVMLKSDVKLFLSCSDCSDSSVVAISNPYAQASRDALDTFVHEFQVSVARECPSVDLTLELMYLEDQRKHKPRVAADLKVALEGTYNPVDENLMQSAKISLDTRPSDRTAILYVDEPQPGKFRVTGWSYRDRPLRTELIDRPEPPIGLAAFIEQKEKVRDIRRNIRVFSRRSPQNLRIWLSRLIERYGEELYVILVDNTASEVPWEMLELNHDKYLGALATVVRWTQVQTFAGSQNLSVHDVEHSGAIIAYLDSIETTHTEQERSALDEFTTSYCETTEELKERLSRPLESVGLVYLGCHGIFTYNDKHKIAVGSLHNPSHRLVSLELEDLHGHEGLRPVILVNACHSARLMHDSSGPYGLPEVLLANVASGYIGTLGPVGSSYATRISRAILHAVQISPVGVRPAEVLRQLRARAVAEIAKSDTQESWLTFLYTFMYVYYGNPLARLWLTGAETTETKT